MRECQDWKGPDFRGHLSQILTPKVTDTSEPRRGRGSGEPGPVLRTLASWLHLPLLRAPSSGFPAVLVCVTAV